ncbi:hypothetical protein EZS27_044496 [termite gut metagenome]|uniref:Uncharacterized protein n=1 Tax=termite gut metagenome TaxID=433724 RepID=A0A5J4P5E2_9ZZZZ
MRRKTGASHTHNAGIGYFLYQFFRRQNATFNECVTTVYVIFPFVAFRINEYGGFGITACIYHRINLSHLTTDGRMDRNRDKTACFGYLGSYLYFIAFSSGM